MLSTYLTWKRRLGAKKNWQAFHVHSEYEKLVITSRAMREILKNLGAGRGCANIRDSTDVFRIILLVDNETYMRKP